MVSGQELDKTKRLRGKPYITKKERTLALPDLEEEGWTKFKNYKDPKFIKVKMDKSFDEIFEDKVWMLFVNLGFTEMNSDRNFVMSYDSGNPEITQQIDIFAADEETIIIVECKAAETIRDGVFKKQIEAFHGQMNGLRKEALKQYPGRKIKFIWATHNYIMSKADLLKMNEWGIAHFSDSTIEYYIELVKHLGRSSRYQLLGNLFTNQVIRNMDELIPAIQGKMGGHTYYSFSIEPERLLKIGYVLHRNEANKNMMPTYQRLIKKKRLNEVQTFINNKGYFPNSLVISIDTQGKGLQFDPSSMRGDTSIAKLGILHLPKKYRSAYIIDGQHRLYGYSNTKYANTNSVPVVAFLDLDREEQIKLFMDINENQKAVPKTLRVILNADLLWDSEDYNERRQALRSKVAQMLGEEVTSPLFGRVVIGENESSPTKCITVEAIQGSLKKCQFFSQYSKKDIIVKDGTFDIGPLQETCDLFYPFIEECLGYIRIHAEDEWIKGDTESGVITINRGIHGIIRLIDDIIIHLIEQSVVNPKKDSIELIMKEMKYYLDPLIDYLNEITTEQRKDLRGYFGGGADRRFWRTFQRVVSDKRGDFKPEGLDLYWEDEEKTYNEESMLYLRAIVIYVKAIIAKRLEEVRGSNWLIVGLPKSVYIRAKKEADDQLYDVIASGGSKESVSIWEYVTLAECRDVITNGRNWTEIFEHILTPPQDENIPGGKDVKTKWLARLNKIDNKLARATYSVSTDEYNFIKSIYNWLGINNS